MVITPLRVHGGQQPKEERTVKDRRKDGKSMTTQGTIRCTEVSDEEEIANAILR
jgi:hypothetical protein